MQNDQFNLGDIVENSFPEREQEIIKLREIVKKQNEMIAALKFSNEVLIQRVSTNICHSLFLKYSHSNWYSRVLNKEQMFWKHCKRHINHRRP